MQRVLSYGLALALLDGAWDRASLQLRARRALGRRLPGVRDLCVRVLAAFPEPPDEVSELSGFIAQDALLAAWRARDVVPRIRKWFFPPPHMAAARGRLAAIRVPWIESEGALATYLDLSPPELSWFADVQRMHATAGCDARLRHYHYRWLKKRSAGYRLLESPKPRLAALQRAIASGILARLPASAAAHGFVPQRSVQSFVAPHVGQRVVLRLDLEDFFASITGYRVRAIFRSLGYPGAVAHLLACLCCVPTPDDIIKAQPLEGSSPAARFACGLRLRTAHLPQGAPSSPVLSNLVAHRLDRRLAGLARAVDARYTRYADDLAFSGGRAFEAVVSRIIPRIGAIVLEEGFVLRYRKTRVMRSGARQMLTGLVLNQKANVPRRDYDGLRAILHNAARFGPQSQNRAQHADFRAHLAGRIAWMAASNPRRGQRLRELFTRIAWDV